MKIAKATRFHSSFRTGSIVPIKHTEITKILGIAPDKVNNDKVKKEWRFLVDGIPCAIWDYKGSHKFNQYSCYMPGLVGKALFGDRYQIEDDYRRDV